MDGRTDGIYLYTVSKAMAKKRIFKSLFGEWDTDRLVDGWSRHDDDVRRMPISGLVELARFRDLVTTSAQRKRIGLLSKKKTQ